MARNNYVFQPPHLDPSKVMAGKAHLLLSPADATYGSTIDSVSRSNGTENVAL